MRIQTLGTLVGFGVQVCAGAAALIWPDKLWIAYGTMAIGVAIAAGSLLWWLAANRKNVASSMRSGVGRLLALRHLRKAHRLWRERDRLELYVIACRSVGMRPQMPVDIDPANSRLRFLADAIVDGRLIVSSGDVNGTGPGDGLMVQIRWTDLSLFAERENHADMNRFVKEWSPPSGAPLPAQPAQQRSKIDALRRELSVPPDAVELKPRHHVKVTRLIVTGRGDQSDVALVVVPLRKCARLDVALAISRQSGPVDTTRHWEPRQTVRLATLNDLVAGEERRIQLAVRRNERSDGKGHVHWYLPLKERRQLLFPLLPILPLLRARVSMGPPDDVDQHFHFILRKVWNQEGEEDLTVLYPTDMNFVGEWEEEDRRNAQGT